MNQPRKTKMYIHVYPSKVVLVDEMIDWGDKTSFLIEPSRPRRALRPETHSAHSRCF